MLVNIMSIVNSKIMNFIIPELESGIVRAPWSDHMISMRVQKDKHYTATDLNGTIAVIRITLLDKNTKSIAFTVLSTQFYPKTREGTLYQALIDRKYQEKLLELLPLTTYERLVWVTTDFSSPQQPQYDRLESIMIRSCSQCETAWKPSISQTVLTINEVLPSEPVILSVPKSRDIQPSSCDQNTCFIGPEGGWSEREEDIFEDNSLRRLSYPGIVYPSWLAGYSHNISIRS
jgi:RsmE family RNA methyltransferase